MDTQYVKVWTGRRILIFVLLFFGVIMAVNAVFMTLALKSHPGVVTENSYERGLAYNETLEQAEFQKKLGWRSDLSISSAPHELIYRLVDRSSVPVSGMTVSAKIIRPVQDGYDFFLVLQEQDDGIYRADFNPPLKGAWNVHISVTWDGGAYYDTVPVVVQ